MPRQARPGRPATLVQSSRRTRRTTRPARPTTIDWRPAAVVRFSLWCDHRRRIRSEFGYACDVGRAFDDR
jgi:hypothetical protein